MPNIENLWGDLSELPDMDLPKHILNAQKEYLESSLKGLVLADVKQVNDSGRIKISFTVFPENNEDMAQELLSVTHGGGIYPAIVKCSVEPVGEDRAEDDESFKRVVHRILSSKEAKHTVNKFRLIAIS